jgi:hypothetical protein
MSHRTKSELKQKAQAEVALSTGIALKERPEVENNATAHKEFKRLNKLLKQLGKNDAIYETIINRYCLMLAECFDLEVKRDKICDTASMLENVLDELRQTEEIKINDLRSAIRGIAEIYGTMIECDRQIQAKRKMLFDIERENIMTIASATRTIPKKEDKSSNDLRDALKDG